MRWPHPSIFCLSVISIVAVVVVAAINVIVVDVFNVAVVAVVPVVAVIVVVAVVAVVNFVRLEEPRYPIFVSLFSDPQLFQGSRKKQKKKRMSLRSFWAFSFARTRHARAAPSSLKILAGSQTSDVYFPMITVPNDTNCPERLKTIGFKTLNAALSLSDTTGEGSNPGIS